MFVTIIRTSTQRSLLTLKPSTSSKLPKVGMKSILILIDLMKDSS